MFNSTFRHTITVLIVLVTVLFGIESLSIGTSPTRAEEATQSKVQALLKSRLTLLIEIEALLTDAFQAGVGSVEDVAEARKAGMGAELELCSTNEERRVVLNNMLKVAIEFEQLITKQVEAGLLRPSAALSAKVYRLDIEIAIERLNRN